MWSLLGGSEDVAFINPADMKSSGKIMHGENNPLRKLVLIRGSEDPNEASVCLTFIDLSSF